MKKLARSDSGFAIPTILGLGIVAGFWILGTAAQVLPSMGRVTVERARDVARSSAEASIDWAIQGLSDVDTRTQMDNRTTTVPSTVLADGEHYYGQITVANVTPPTDSYLYDPNIDPSAPSSNIGGGNGWRSVTARVSSNGLSVGAARTVRVILKPVYALTTTTDNVIETYQGDPVSIYQDAMLAKGEIGGGGNLFTDSYDSRLFKNPIIFDQYDGDVTTNKEVALGGNSVIAGDLTVKSDTSESGKSETVATGTGNAKVKGDIQTNGQVEGFTNQDPGNAPQTGLDIPPASLPPVPTPPSSAVDLGAISLAGNNVIKLSANGVTINGTFTPNTSGGHYTANSIAVSGNAKIQIDNSAGPVNMYVQGAGSGNGISLTGNGIVNTGYPSDFRIWYNGTGDTKIAGNGTSRMVIFAPNSAYKQTGNGELYGAIVANTMHLGGNARIHYDRALGAVTDLMYRPMETRTVPITVSNRLIKSFQAVSWDEW